MNWYTNTIGKILEFKKEDYDDLFKKLEIISQSKKVMNERNEFINSSIELIFNKTKNDKVYNFVFNVLRRKRTINSSDFRFVHRLIDYTSEDNNSKNFINSIFRTFGKDWDRLNDIVDDCLNEEHLVFFNFTRTNPNTIPFINSNLKNQSSKGTDVLYLLNFIFNIHKLDLFAVKNNEFVYVMLYYFLKRYNYSILADNSNFMDFEQFKTLLYESNGDVLKFLKKSINLLYNITIAQENIQRRSR